MKEWNCSKCGKTFKTASELTRHLRRKTPCDLIRNEKTLLERMKNRYEDRWRNLEDLFKEIEAVGNIDELMTLSKIIKERFYEIERDKQLVDPDYTDEQVKLDKEDVLKRLNEKRAKFISFEL